MTKINKILTAALIAIIGSIFCLQNSYADISAPYVFERKIYVTNPDGIDTYKRDQDTYVVKDHLPYGSVLYLTQGQSAYDGYLTVADESVIYAVYIKEGGFELANEPFDLSSIEAAQERRSYTIDAETCFYNGPDASYGRISDNYCLPAGVTVKSVYYDALWMYTEYDNHSGWVFYGGIYGSYNGMISHLINFANDDAFKSGSFFSVSKINLYNLPRDGEIIYTAQPNELTEIHYDYYYNQNPFNYAYYINIDGEAGWVYSSETKMASNEYSGTITTLQSINLRKSFNDVDNVVSVPAGQTLDIKYHVSEGRYDMGDYYVTSSEYEGWIMSMGGLCSDGADNECTKIITINEKYNNSGQTSTLIDGENSIDEEDDVEKEDSVSIDIERFYQENTETEDPVQNMILWLIIGCGILAASLIVVLIIMKKKRTSKEKKVQPGAPNNNQDSPVKTSESAEKQPAKEAKTETREVVDDAEQTQKENDADQNNPIISVNPNQEEPEGDQAASTLSNEENEETAETDSIETNEPNQEELADISELNSTETSEANETESETPEQNNGKTEDDE